MLTQSKLNNIIQRTVILLNYQSLEAPLILVDVKEFFNKLKSVEKITQIPEPNEVDINLYDRCIYFEWYEVQKDSTFDYVRMEFDGSSKVKLVADYESKEIDIEQSLPLDEDFPELILTHLRQFKKPIKKKRYK